MAVYRTLQQRTDDRLEEINIAPAFFSTVIDALFSVIVLWTDKMFDEKSKRGLVNFLTFCEHNRRIFKVKELQRRRGYPDDHWMLQDRADVRLFVAWYPLNFVAFVDIANPVAVWADFTGFDRISGLSTRAVARIE